MIFNNYYSIDLVFNNENLELEPQNYSFSIHDSIRSFYSNATIKIKDSTGLLRDSLFFEEGNKFSISYGIKTLEKNTLSSNYVTIHDDADSIVTQGILSGDTTISLLHDFYSYQAVENKAYNNRISSIIDQITNYKFTKKNINDTGSKSIWYQLRCDQKTFITDVLLPNAYSNNSNKTPFFCFIDCNNELNFRNYRSMIESTPICTLIYNAINPLETSFYNILDIKPFRVGSLITKKLRNRKIVTRNKDDGNFNIKNNLLSLLPENMFQDYSLPIIDDLSLETNYQYYSFTQSKSGEKEALQARIIYDEIDGFFLEKFIITTNFNPMLKSGATINLEVSVGSQSGFGEKSLYQSGVYLIEDCIHSWVGEERKGLSQLIVSRKFIKNKNLLSEKLAK